ncbi:hypothetical protein CcCBS67573_g00163 [Chytriomyces confervae]|uniref:Cyclic nucleotide-binding domain-containing protein n=1 Tax=Chytriomyces confervae TaxID=246404 RepID=A0A507FTD2_9FUNG|nr:hypothetical protein CcCBS67573_g00163 [Chytriomyces confervae]
MSSASAAIVAETLELQASLLRLQTHTIAISAQVQSGLSSVARVLELAFSSASIPSGGDSPQEIPTLSTTVFAAADAIAVSRSDTTSSSSPERIDRYKHQPDTLNNPPTKRKSRIKRKISQNHSFSETHLDMEVTHTKHQPTALLSNGVNEESAHDESIRISKEINEKHLSMGVHWDSQDYLRTNKKHESVVSDPEMTRTNSSEKAAATSKLPRSATIQGSSVKASNSQDSSKFNNVITKSQTSSSPSGVLNVRNWIGRTFTGSSPNAVGVDVNEKVLPMYLPPQVNEPPQPLKRPRNKFLRRVEASNLNQNLLGFASHRLTIPSPPSTIQRKPEGLQPHDVSIKHDKMKWQKLRHETIQSSAKSVDAGVSSAVTAMFPDVKDGSTNSLHNKKRARENWAKLRKAVFARDQMEMIGSLAITALPDITKLNNKLDLNDTDIEPYEAVPYHTWSAYMHWFLMCPAFDDNGVYMSIAQYHATDYRLHKFSRDGFNPTSLFNTVLNTILIFCFFYLMVAIPYQLAYDESSWGLAVLEFIIFVVFFFDSVVGFLTPLKPPKTDLKHKVKRPDLFEWRKRYVNRVFFINLITAIPWAYILPPAYKPAVLIHLIRCSRLPGMMSRSPIFIKVHMYTEAIVGIGNILSRMIPVGILVIYFIHFQACILYYTGKVTGFQNWNEQFSHWQFFPGGILAASVAEQYVWMLYQAMGNMFQSTFRPETIVEQVLTMMFIIIGALLYATLVGLISSAAISYDASGRLYRQKIDELTEYLHWKNIDTDTKKRLLQYYEFKYKGKYFEEKNLLADMNESLRREISSITCKQLIEKVPFLKREIRDGRDGLYLGKIATALIPATFIPGDRIICQGEQATHMFFILNGKVDVLVNGNVVATICDGGFFGEVALVANIPRTATVIAATPCNLYTLSSADFNSIIVEFEDMRERIDKIYEERMAKVRLEQAATLFMGGQKKDIAQNGYSGYRRFSTFPGH